MKRRRKPDRPTKIAYMVSVFVLLFGVFVMLFPTGQLLHIKLMTKSCTVEVEAKVAELIDTELVTRDDGFDRVHISYAPVVEYTTLEGKEIRAKHFVYKAPPVCEVGETVRILYDPEDPQLFAMPDHDFKGSARHFLFSAFGIPIVMIGIKMILIVKSNATYIGG